MAQTSFFDKLINKRAKNRVASDGLLADQEALNLGTLFEVPAAPEGTTGLQKFGNPVRLLNIEGEDADAETLMITLQQEVILLQPSTVPTPGPVVGLIEFGSGSGIARLEFDIPSPVGGPAPNVASGALSAANIFTPLKSNVVTLVIPASSLRVFARNDAQTGFLANFNGTTINTSIASRATPARVRVHAAYGKANMNKQCVRRVYYIAGQGTPLVPSPGVVNNVVIGVPPFSRRVWFPRTPLSQLIRISLFDYYGGPYTFFDIPSGSVGPIELPPHVGGITVLNPATNPLDFDSVAAVFDLEF